jgi:hypothetical protein
MSEQRQTTRPEGTETGPAPEPPPWWEEFEAAARGSGGAPPRGFPDLTPLLAVVDAMRRVVPLELQGQLNALQRELLLTIRALIDWYLERLEGSQRATVVEDIPID